jgi:hypothetical protein
MRGILTEGTEKMEIEPGLPVKRINGRMWQPAKWSVPKSVLAGH